MQPARLPLADRLSRESERICSLILNSDLEQIDVALEINSLRETCRAEAPELLELFEAVYVSRFNRLWRQWRCPGTAQQPEEETWSWMSESFF